MNKIGLILEGGGMRGLFSAGVMDVMMENGIEFDGAVGVSAGATFGCNYKSRQPGRVLRYNLRFRKDPRYIGWRSLLRTGDLVGGSFSYHYMPLKLDIFDTEAYEKNPMEFHVVCTDVDTGDAVYRRLDRIDYTALEWMRASASLPVLSRPVQIGTRRLLDGGIADSIPLRYFESEGFMRNIVILTQPKGYVKQRTRLMPIIKATMRKYPAIIEAMNRRHIMYNRELAYITELQKQGKCLIICPDDTLPISRTSQDEEKMKAVYQMGRNVALARMDVIKSFLEKSRKELGRQ